MSPIHEKWEEGKLQGKALLTFLAEISQITHREHIQKIKLTLKTQIQTTIITVFNGAEKVWEDAKMRIVQNLKEAAADVRAKTSDLSCSFDILIEPFYEDALVVEKRRGDVDGGDDIEIVGI